MGTGHGIKYRQLHIEDYLREIPAEQGRVTGVYAHEGITGNTDTDTDFWKYVSVGGGSLEEDWNRRTGIYAMFD